MKYLKRFNENQNTSILQQLISTLDKYTKDNYKDNYYQ